MNSEEKLQQKEAQENSLVTNPILPNHLGIITALWLDTAIIGMVCYVWPGLRYWADQQLARWLIFSIVWISKKNSV